LPARKKTRKNRRLRLRRYPHQGGTQLGKSGGPQLGNPASTTNAEVTIKSYKASKAAGGHGWATMRIYINGLATAFMYANLDLEQNKHSMLYCKPEKFALMNENLIEILDQ
jgi:hypothetical protein